MNAKRVFPWLLVAILTLIAMAGCRPPETTLVALVPQNANIIASIQMSRITADPDLNGAFENIFGAGGGSEILGQEIDNPLADIGIDYNQLPEIVIFGDIDSEEMAFIVHGDFNPDDLIAGLKEAAPVELTDSDYKGFTLYSDEAQEFAVTFLEETILLLGTPRAVKDVIDVSLGEQPPVGGIVLETYDRLGNALIKVAVELPEEARQEMAGGNIANDFPMSLEAFANLETVGLGIDKRDQNVTFRLAGHFFNAGAAQDARDTVDGLIFLFKGTIQEPEIEALLDKIDLTIAESWVTLSLAMTMSEIEQLPSSLSP